MKNNKGITLIALVVTIIIVIILASVSISILLGNSGLMNNAGKTKDIVRAKEIKELIQMDVLYNDMIDNIGGIKKTKNQLIDELYTNGRLTSEEVEILEGSDTITIGETLLDFSVLPND